MTEQDAASRARSSSRPPLRYRSIFISDTHLGKSVAQAAMLLEFLENSECETLYLVGDILDGWHIQGKKNVRIREMHARVLDALNCKAASGMKVVYVPGNHDDTLRRSGIVNRTITFRGSPQKRGPACPIVFDNGLIHNGADGLNYLVLHGDQFDARVLKTAAGKAVSVAADHLYDFGVVLNAGVIHLSLKYLNRQVSALAHIKKKTKSLVGFIEIFSKSVAQAVRKSGKKIDGVICGHIHHAEITDIKGVAYMNTGDWVESCTALTESEDGTWGTLYWRTEREKLGLKALPEETEPNPNAAYRPVTEQQLHIFSRLCPSTGLLKQGARIRKLREEIRAISAMVEANGGPPPLTEAEEHLLGGMLRRHERKREEMEERIRTLAEREPSGNLSADWHEHETLAKIGRLTARRDFHCRAAEKYRDALDGRHPRLRALGEAMELEIQRFRDLRRGYIPAS